MNAVIIFQFFKRGNSFTSSTHLSYSKKNLVQGNIIIIIITIIIVNFLLNSCQFLFFFLFFPILLHFSFLNLPTIALFRFSSSLFLFLLLFVYVLFFSFICMFLYLVSTLLTRLSFFFPHLACTLSSLLYSPSPAYCS